MRFIIASGLAVATILLASCTTTTSNSYTQTVQSWRGADAHSLVKQWGTPDNRITKANGNAVYVYTTRSTRTYNDTSNPQVGVNFNGKSNPLITVANTNGLNRGTLSLNCIATFEVNKHGTITHVAVQGNGCYADARLANKLPNPAPAASN